MVLLFVTQVVSAQFQNFTQGAKSTLMALSMIPFDRASWLISGQVAAWRLKWIMIPLTLLIVFGGRRLYRSVLAEPSRFCGIRYAKTGYIAAVSVPLLVLLLIGITIPKRLEHRQWGIEAGIKAQGYRIDRALRDYHEAFGTLPSDIKDLSKLPDEDGSLAAALKNVDGSGYVANSEYAVVPSKKTRPIRPAVIRNASFSGAADEPLSGGISFTNYELRLPGPDQILNNDDDLIVIDGITYQTWDKLPQGTRKITSTPKKQ